MMADQDPEPLSPNDITSKDQPALTTAEARIRRPVYEPTLLPPRKRRRASPYVVIPVLLLLLGGVLYLLLAAPHHRRFVATAGETVWASDAGTPGQTHLWISGPNGGPARRLTHEAAAESSPTWSPDGSQVAFLAAPGGGDPQIFVVDADGKNLAQVTHTAGAKSQPSFAPSDNNLIGFTSGGAFSVATVTTGETSRLLPTSSENSHSDNADATGGAPTPDVISSFDWSPSKEKAQQGMAGVEDNAGTQTLVLLSTLSAAPLDSRNGPNGPVPLAAADTLSLGWSPDGALLAVALLGIQGLPPGRQASGMLLFDAQGQATGQRPLALFPGSALGPEHPIFSPDGTQVVCELWQSSDLARQHSVGLFSVSIDGSTAPRPIYKGSAEDVHFSSDGQSLLFLQTRSGNGHDLCRIAQDGTGFARLSNGIEDVTAFAVSPQSSSTH